MSRSALVITILSALSLALACGCADDLRGRNLFDAGAGEAMIRFSVDNISLTRADVEPDKESLVNHAYLLFYASDATVETDVPVAAVKAEVSESNPTALTFKMPLILQANADYRLVALANADSYTPEGYANFAEYLQAWSVLSIEERRQLLLQHADRIQTSDSRPLPMRGRIENDAPFRFIMQNGVYSVSTSLTFRRAVARIDVANIVKEGFRVEGVALCNWRDATSAISEEGNRLGAVRGVLSDENVGTPAFVTMPSADENGIQSLHEAIYCFPSVTYDSHASDNESTALIIKAKYGQDTESSYYRVNVGTSGNKAEVKANTKYLVTIQSVKGSAAPTAHEAYAAEESLIVLSVVEDWDLDYGNYAMDDNGNFIVLSTGHLEFAGDVVENREIRVLTSKGMTWNVAPDPEETSTAFNVSKLSNVSLAIGPKGKNDKDEKLTGKFIVTATSSDGGNLTLYILVEQLPAVEQPEDPIIPDDMPFALIPQSYDRVKINHVERTIEIDGFDPYCFNSFIDIPFKVYIKDPTLPSVDISTTLQWPLEGRISLDRSSQYFYCQQSFAAFGSGQVQQENSTLVPYTQLVGDPISRSNDEEIYISVGAMGPDDPAITGRTIKLQASNGEEVNYDLTVKPRPCIIDDVILSDESDNYWLIQDRNIQDYNNFNPDYSEYIGLDKNGKKRQAYNYSNITSLSNKNENIKIPFKFTPEYNTFSEETHGLYCGKAISFSSRSTLYANENTKGSRLYWLKKYSYSEDISRVSPFYEYDDSDNNFQKWVFPKLSMIEALRSKLRVSKMRMYLVSEYDAKSGNSKNPVCCYLPYHCYTMGDFMAGYTYGYYSSSSDEVTVDKITIIYLDNEGVKTYQPGNSSGHIGLSRLVRSLTADELEYYKQNYLGYGTEPHKLTICHPDTYTSPGWLEF